MSEFCIWRRVCRALSSSSQDMKEQIRRVRSSQPCRNFPGLKLSLFQCNHLSWSFILILGCRTCGVKQKPPWSPWAMTKYPLTSGLNGCIMRSEETEAAFSSLEKWEYPALLPPLCWCLLGAVGGGKEEESISCEINQEENASRFYLLPCSLPFWSDSDQKWLSWKQVSASCVSV